MGLSSEANHCFFKQTVEIRGEHEIACQRALGQCEVQCVGATHIVKDVQYVQVRIGSLLDRFEKLLEAH